MRFLGLKPARYRQWRDLLAAEFRVLGWRERCQLVIEISFHLPRLVRHKRERFRRLRKCYRCPVFDRAWKRCGPREFPELGCRCYMPLAALVKEHGWLTVTVGDPDKFCW